MTAETSLEAIDRILASVPLFDGHNDVPYQLRVRADNDLAALDLHDTSALEPPMHTDLARLRRGRVGAQFWAAYVPIECAGPGAARVMFEQIEVTHAMIERYPESLELALGADDIERIHADGRIASLVAVEGGHGLENSIALLRRTYAAGVRYLTLVHNVHTDWADCCRQDPRHGGLTGLGREIIAEMNQLGMLVDLSHSSADTMRDVLGVSTAPVACTHSGARAVNDYPRNVPDDVLTAIAANGGIVMATFVPYFVCAEVLAHKAARAAEVERLALSHPDEPQRRADAIARWDGGNPVPRATLAQVADHIDHLCRMMGHEHVGIGSDFDGIGEVPVGLEDVSCYPALLSELLARGYDEQQVAAIAGGNLLRVLRGVEAAATQA